MFLMLASIHSPTLRGTNNADCECCCCKGCTRGCWCWCGGGNPVEETSCVPGLTLVALSRVQQAVFLHIWLFPAHTTNKWMCWLNKTKYLCFGKDFYQSLIVSFAKRFFKRFFKFLKKKQQKITPKTHHFQNILCFANLGRNFVQIL
jgi:hypothetical protein